jgi:hypothetical protein
MGSPGAMHGVAATAGAKAAIHANSRAARIVLNVRDGRRRPAAALTSRPTRPRGYASLCLSTCRSLETDEARSLFDCLLLVLLIAQDQRNLAGTDFPNVVVDAHAQPAG